MHRFVAMTKRYSVVFVLLVFSLVGCGNKSKRADEKLATDKQTPAFLAAVPADTPYVFASIEPVPLGPLLQWMQLWGDTMSGAAGEIEAVLTDEYVDSGTKAVFAFADEMKGNFSREGFARVGLSTSPRVAIYGLGLLPAAKMDLDDPEKFNALIERIETRSGLKRVSETIGKHPYWSYEVGFDELFVMAVQNRQVVFGLTPKAGAATYVQYLVGEKMPEQSMADVGVLKEIATQWGFQNFGVGYIDFARIAQMYVDPKPGLNDELLRAMMPELPVASDACKQEIQGLVAKAPRFVFGYEKWSNTEATMGAAWELTGTLGEELVAAKSPAPFSGTDLSANSVASVALGFEVGKVFDIVISRLNSIRDNPYQCEWLIGANSVASEVANAAPMFAQPMFRQIRGAAVIVQNIRESSAARQAPAAAVNPDDTSMFGSGHSIAVEGVAGIATSDAVTLFGFLKSLVPELAAVAVMPDGRPVALPPISWLGLLEFPQLVLTPELIIVTSGEGASDDVARRAEPGPSSPFFSMSYDYSKIAKALNIATPGSQSLRNTRIELDPRKEGIHFRTHFPFGAPTDAR